MSYGEERSRLIDNLVSYGVLKNKAVVDVMRRVPRHLFVPGAVRDSAYVDTPQPIGPPMQAKPMRKAKRFMVLSPTRTSNSRLSIWGESRRRPSSRKRSVTRLDCTEPYALGRSARTPLCE